MTIRRILITGSSGMIGTRLCEKLLENNYDIVGVDLKPNKWNSKLNNFAIIGDLRDNKTLKKLPKNIDLVIHLAANARVYNLISKPVLAKDNFDILFNVLEFCKYNNVKRFFFTSSREIYGNSRKVFHSENDLLIQNCENAYGASKLGGEALIYAYKKSYGINFIVVRFSNVYGMYDDSDRVIPLFIKLTKENKNITIYGKEKLLDFIYIDDAISGVLKCVDKFDVVENEVFNIASGKGIPIVELANLIKEYNKKSKSKIIVKENRTGEVIKFIADISKAEKKLNFKPANTIIEGIIKTIKWYNAYYKSLRRIIFDD